MWISVSKSENEKIFVNVKYIYCDATLNQYNTHMKKVEEIVNITAPNSQFLLLGDYYIYVGYVKHKVSLEKGSVKFCRRHAINCELK